MSEITVHIVVTDANGKDSDVRVTSFIRPGDCIPEKINVLAAEAASMAYMTLTSMSSPPLHRDRRKGR